MNGESPRFFFCHLQKTGGVALSRRLRHQFPAEAVYPGPTDGDPPESTVSVPHLLERWEARRDEIQVVCGHYPLCTTELLGGEFRTFTMLRDPVDRVLSSLRHNWRANPDRRALTLDEVYDDELRFKLLLENHMVRMLSLTVDEMDDGMYSQVSYDDARLERAKAALDAVDVVGLQRDHEGFCAELEASFGWDLGPVVTSNVTDPAEASTDLRERIASDNRYDVALYEHAEELTASRAPVARSTRVRGS